MANQFTTKEVLNKVLLDSSGDAITANSVTSQEALNAVLDTSNNRLNVSLGGSNTISGDVTITGDLTVQGSATNTFDEQIQGIVQILGSAGTGATPAGTLQLTTSETTIVDNDQLGRIEFLAASEADGSDSQLVGASIAGEAEATFAADNNSTALVFSTNTSAAATERMRITSAGLVGIGATPSAVLHLFRNNTDTNLLIECTHSVSSASIDLRSATDRDSTVMFREGSTLKAQVLHDASADSLVLTDGANSNTVFINANKVGIGESSPDQLLHISGTAPVIRLQETADSAIEDTNAIASIEAWANDSGERKAGSIAFVASEQWGADTDDAPTAITFNTQTNDGTDEFGERMRIEGAVGGTPLIGIGTASPSEALHISSSEASATPVLLLENTNANNLPAQINFYKNTSDEDDDDWLGQIDFEGNDSGGNRHQYGRIASRSTDVADGSEDGNIIFSTMKAGTLTDTLILESGNAGIGTSSPVAQGLTVANAGDVNLTLLADSNADGANNWSMIDFRVDNTSGNPEARIYYKQDITSLVLATANTNRLILDSNSRISLSNNDSGTSNTVYGYQAGNLIGAGDNFNVFIGHQVADADMTNATNNVGVGYQSLGALTEGDNNIALGYQSADAITSGSANVAIGTSSLGANTATHNNVAVGTSVLQSLEASSQNTAIGSGAMSSIGTGASGLSNCVAIGYQAFQGGVNTTTGANGTVAVGMNSLTAQTTAIGNTAVGYFSLSTATTGGYNTAVGNVALDACTGTSNTAVGFGALGSVVGGGTNIGIGSGAGNKGGGSGADLTTGNENTLIGNVTRVSTAGAENQTVIGYDAVGQADDSVTLGNADVTAVYMAQDSGATVHCAGVVVSEGINFPDDASASPSSDANTLDNYEEGVFEVAVTGATSGSWSTSSSGGYLNYVKIGKLCHISGYIEVDTDNSASGLVKITLPFTSATGLTEASDLQWGSASVADGGTTLNAVVSGAYIPENQAYFHLYHVTDAGAYTYYSDSNLDAGWVARVGFTYRTNN